MNFAFLSVTTWVEIFEVWINLCAGVFTATRNVLASCVSYKITWICDIRSLFWYLKDDSAQHWTVPFTQSRYPEAGILEGMSCWDIQYWVSVSWTHVPPVRVMWTGYSGEFLIDSIWALRIFLILWEQLSWYQDNWEDEDRKIPASFWANGGLKLGKQGREGGGSLKWTLTNAIKLTALLNISN